MKANKHPAGMVAGKIPHFIADETGKYRAPKALTEAQIIKAAKALLSIRYRPGMPLTSPDLTRDWLQLHYQ